MRQTRFVHPAEYHLLWHRAYFATKSYFKETQLPPVLCSLLLYPFTLPLHEPAPQEFALQFWDEQKAINAGLVIGILGMLIGNKSSGVSASAFLN